MHRPLRTCSSTRISTDSESLTTRSANRIDVENEQETEQFDAVVLGGGNGGMNLAWHLAGSGMRTAVVERRWIGGSCPNVNCLPGKNEIWSAKVADLMHHAASFGAMTGSAAIDMAKVRQRKRDMVKGEVAAVLQQYESSGAELVMGDGH